MQTDSSVPVVYLSFPTSNHNPQQTSPRITLLYISLFLHQTTTSRWVISSACRCISLFSYIKPQQFTMYAIAEVRCISLFSYIKPQRKQINGTQFIVVYLSFPTSNHNLPTRAKNLPTVVYLSFPTSNHNPGELLPYLIAFYNSNKA